MSKPFPDVKRVPPSYSDIQDFGGITAATWAKYPHAMTQEVMKSLIKRHFEELVCSRCKEWTSRGESCCGMSECDQDCPVCIEEGVFS